MPKEKQTLQLLHDGYSRRPIASSLQVSRNTVARVLKAVLYQKMSLETTEEADLRHMLFPEEVLIPSLVTPDFAYLHKESLKSGVTLKLLWQEYIDTCRNAGSPPYNWDKAGFLKWASGIGEATCQVIQGIFDSYWIEEQAVSVPSEIIR